MNKEAKEKTRELGFTLRTCRQELNMTQEKVALGAYMSTGNYCKKENGIVPIYGWDLLNITQSMNVSTDTIRERQRNKKEDSKKNINSKVI